MKPLIREALLITKELGDVIFIGALSRYLHTKYLRESQDIDCIIEKPISDDELIDMGYKKDYRNGKEILYTPRGIKIDIYTSDVGKIPLQQLISNSVHIPVSKKNEKLRTLGLESLIITKHRAQREQDIDDLRAIAETRYDKIDWKKLREISGDEHEYDKIKTDMNYLKST